MNPKVSILIPVYNTALFIEKCAHSLFQQTLEDIEFIFWNDASTDNSVQLLKEVIHQYPNRKDQIRIFSNNLNQGASAVRLALIKAAKGVFIGMVDSDDYIDAEMYKELYQKAISENADIVLSDLILEYKTSSIRVFEPYADSNHQYLENLLSNKESNSLCNKLIKKDLFIINKCYSPTGLDYSEDWFMLIHLYYYSSKMTRIDKAYYHYIQHKNSATKCINEMHFKSIILFWDLITDFLKTKKLLNKYQEEIKLQRIISKVNLMMSTDSYKLRKKYAHLYAVDELFYLNFFRMGEKMLIIFLHYKLYFLAHLVQKLVAKKNKRQLMY
jgi:glycosyltransferase involved in cell wall biosynthesis